MGFWKALTGKSWKETVSGGGSSTPKKDDKKKSTTLGQVSQTGQYAGDGFEWVQNDNTNALTRVYTGVGKDNNLGTDVKIAGASDKNTKNTIAAISANEGSAFATTKASGTTGIPFIDPAKSFTEEQGISYTPTITYDSTKTGAENDAIRASQTPSVPAIKPEPRPEPPDPTNFAVSQGEAGRGGPDSAAPTFTYQPGIDPEMEMLVSLLNTAPQTLSAGERLMAQQYQREKLAGGSPTGGVQVADAGILSNLTNYATDLGSDIYRALTFQDPIGEKVASGIVGIPGEASNMAFGLRDYFQARPVSYSGNPLLDLGQEIMLRLQPDATQDMILSQSPEEAAQRGQFSGAAGEFLGDLGEKVEGYFFPDGRDQAVVTGTTPGDLALETVEGQGGYSGLGNVVAEEVGGGLSTDIPLSYLGLPGMTASAILNFGEQIGGGEANTRQALDVLEQQGILQNNPVFLDALEKQGGDVDAAKDALVRANVFSSAPAIGGTGAIDAFIPAPGKGFIGAGKNLLLRGGVEGGQEVVESMAALDGLNNLLNLQGDQQIKVTQDASGNFVMGALAGTGTSVAASPLSGLTASQREAANQNALANQAAMQQAAGTQGIASFAVAPANQTAVSTQPEAMTTSPTVFNPNISPTAGELAQSNVPTSYDIEQDRVAGLLEGPQALDSSASSLDVIAAQQVIEDQIQQTGTVSPQTISDLRAATGLSENDLNSIAVNVALGISSDQAVPTSAIQMFNQAAAPSTDPSIDTAAPSLPTFNVAGAPGQPVLPAGVDTLPIIPTRSTTPDIPRIDVAGLGSLQTDFVPNIDTASFQQGTDDTTAEVQLPATTDGDTLPAATGTEVIIDDDGSARQVGGLEGEILGPEISTEVNPEEDTGVTIDMEATTETDTTPQIETDNLVQSNIPNVTRTTTTDTAVDQNIKPLTEVGEFPEPPEEVDPEEPVVVEVEVETPMIVPPETRTNDEGEEIVECPDGYTMVQTADGPICQKTRTEVRQRAGAGTRAYTGLATRGQRGPGQRRITVTDTERVDPITRSA